MYQQHFSNNNISTSTYNTKLNSAISYIKLIIKSIHPSKKNLITKTYEHNMTKIQTKELDTQHLQLKCSYDNISPFNVK